MVMCPGGRLKPRLLGGTGFADGFDVSLGGLAATNFFRFCPDTISLGTHRIKTVRPLVEVDWEVLITWESPKIRGFNIDLEVVERLLQDSHKKDPPVF